MEGRMTVCNMSIEWGAKAGLIAPDQTTFDYIEGRPEAPRGEAWDEPCAPCAGAGHTEETRDVTIALPRGLSDGDRLLVRLGGRHVVPTAVTLHVTLT